ncbi:MAG: DUF2948 family protein [Pseudomonadota bacterium]
MDDARFEDAGFSDQPLRLGLADADDVPVISALMQDAVGLSGEISWMPRRRRLVILLNRFRWEDRDDAKRQSRPFERVRAALILDTVNGVQASGLDPRDKDTVYSILSMTWTPADDPAGRLEIALAGDGALGINVECLDGQLVDLTRPWEAKSGAAPDHQLDD